MSPNTPSGQGFISKPAEESVPYDDWLSWLISFAVACVKHLHLKVNIGRRYTAHDFWMVLIAHALFCQSLDETSDRLNEMLWERENSRRRHKLSPPEYGGAFRRRKRKCPNGSQVRAYRNSLPKWLVKSLSRFIFGRQLDSIVEAKEHFGDSPCYLSLRHSIEPY